MLTPAHDTLVADGGVELETIEVVIGFDKVTGGEGGGADEETGAADDGGLPPAAGVHW